MGTPCEAYKEAGAKVWNYEQSSYGGTEVITGDLNFNPFRYQGQYEDAETGLYYNRFRYYSPEEECYISQDPIRLMGGMELYNYVHDANAWVDVLGLVRIHTEDGVKINAFPGPAAGGIEQAPLHVHVIDGSTETRVLMEDYSKKGKLIGKKGEVYPGDLPMTKKMKKVVENNIDSLEKKANEVFTTGHVH